ncbi:hypothetical protein PAXRUDRAFT_156933 [Paxillus rubicundulus Ve08.2h10]|uniref:Uncharacterized protein n=1 Tax=Paxillus rubicundulus Ve08.2h10 TaxID=930991 RepID=A0A0D0DPU0_9AGAM|nr:hypothetical protein PAXRUDRAFT_156933 [Paxillus rubicundulus Ve08.2h10]
MTTRLLTLPSSGSVQLSLHLHSDESKFCAPSAKADPVDLSVIPLDYHGFTDAKPCSEPYTLSLPLSWTPSVLPWKTPLPILPPPVQSSCLQDKWLTPPLHQLLRPQ